MNYFLYSFCLLLTFLPVVTSAQALVLGLILGLGLQITPPKSWKPLGKWLMQGAIVAMGLAMKPEQVSAATSSGVVITAASIFIVLGLGHVLSTMMRIPRGTGALITVGTGICGGSAIAAIAPVINATEEETAVSFATVFSLNAVALLIFPFLGHFFALDSSQFGYFAALAIHDTSSVVGAATQFDAASVPIAIAIKLTRALWIIPLIFLFLTVERLQKKGEEKKAKAQMPWFILFFILAIFFHGFFPDFETFYKISDTAGKTVLRGAIFLISAQMTRGAIRKVGLKPLIFAIILWLIVSVGTLIGAKMGIFPALPT